MAVEGRPKKIFISHAAEDPDWPHTAVEALAAKLQTAGAGVLLDLHQETHLGRKLSEDEWRRWMRDSIDQADTVLCLVTRLYCSLAELKSDDTERGRGVAMECAEFDDWIYERKQRNEGWIWLCMLDSEPDRRAVVPRFLKRRCPEYSVPNEEQRLVRDLVGVAARSAESTGGSGPEQTGAVAEADPLNDQRELVLERLKQVPALWSVLSSDGWQGNRPVATHSEAAFATWLAGASPEQAENAMFAVRRALDKVSLAEEARRPAELATVAVYALAACRLVDRNAAHVATRFPAQIGHAAHLYCAVVATVLFGGRLEFAPSAQPGLPRPPNAYEIRVPAAGDQRNQAFEHAVFQALFANDPRTPEVSLDATPLTEQQRAQIRRRIQTVRRRQLQTLTLVVHADALYPPADVFAREFLVPVFVCDREIAAALLGMSAEDLVADIQEMWSELRFCNRPGSNAAPATSTEN